MTNNPQSLKKQLRLLAVSLPVIGLAGTVFPFLLKYITNRVLKKYPGFYGEVSQINTSFNGNTITIKGLQIDMRHRDSNEQVLAITGRQITIRLDRHALRNGIVGLDLVLDTPGITIMRTRMSRRIKQALGAKIPVALNHLVVQHGSVAYVDETVSPAVKAGLSSLNVEGKSITNLPRKEELPCCISYNAKAYGGTLKGDMKIGLMQQLPAFDVNMKVTDIDMPQLNHFLHTYAKFDVNKGTLGLYTEIAARNGKFKGYVKPVIKDLDVLGPEDSNKGILNKIWQGLVGATATIFENPANGQIATKIPFEGTFDEPEINTWYAIGKVLGNAFVAAIKPSLDFSINLGSVKQLRRGGH